MHVDQGPDRNALASGSVTISSNPTQGPSVTIPDGYSIVIKARRTNTGVCYIETANATSTSKYSLAAGEFIALFITNLNLVWFSDTVNTDIIEYIVEQ